MMADRSVAMATSAIACMAAVQFSSVGFELFFAAVLKYLSSLTDMHRLLIDDDPCMVPNTKA